MTICACVAQMFTWSVFFLPSFFLLLFSLFLVKSGPVLLIMARTCVGSLQLSKMIIMTKCTVSCTDYAPRSYCCTHWWTKCTFGTTTCYDRYQCGRMYIRNDLGRTFFIKKVFGSMFWNYPVLAPFWQWAEIIPQGFIRWFLK